MNNMTYTNDNGSMATTPVVVESKPQETTFENADVERYCVPLDVQINLELTGIVEVYAVSESEAVAKVLRQINAGTVDYQMEMVDVSGYTMTLDDVITYFRDPIEIEIDESSVTTDDFDIDPDEVLEAQINELESDIVWNSDALTKHKQFLEALLGGLD